MGGAVAAAVFFYFRPSPHGACCICTMSGGRYDSFACRSAIRQGLAAASSLRPVSVFAVRLQCEVAPQIGCGLRAKPVLQEVERQTGVSEAWLNRAGNLLAVVGTPQGCQSALQVLRRRRLKATPLQGKRLEAALGDFASGAGWHRNAELDRLSAEEARIIARRITRRLRARIAQPPSKGRSRPRARALIHNPTQSAPARKRRLAKAILASAEGYGDDNLLRAFAEVARLGHRPLPGER